MDNWKEKVLNSLEGIERVKPSLDSFDKIQSRIKNGETATSKTLSRSWLSVAAVISLVICCNAFFISKYYNANELSYTETTYDELITDFNIYEL